MKYHEIGEKFEYEGVMLEVVKSATSQRKDSCDLCYLHTKFRNTPSVCDLPCEEWNRKDSKEVYYKLVEKCKTKDMEQGVESRCEGRDEVFAYTAKENPKLEDLKDGDFVAFDYNGNTAVTKLVSDKGDFMYAVGLWHDSNLVGKEDAIWYADNINDVNSVEPITNLH